MLCLQVASHVPAPMTDPDVAALLEAFADKVIRLPGVSATRPHAFAESKSELRGEMLSKAKDLRTGSATTVKPLSVGGIHSGARTIGRREVAVVTRGRRG